MPYAIFMRESYINGECGGMDDGPLDQALKTLKKAHNYDVREGNTPGPKLKRGDRILYRECYPGKSEPTDWIEAVIP